MPATSIFIHCPISFFFLISYSWYYIVIKLLQHLWRISMGPNREKKSTRGTSMLHTRTFLCVRRLEFAGICTLHCRRLSLLCIIRPIKITSINLFGPVTINSTWKSPINYRQTKPKQIKQQSVFTIYHPPQKANQVEVKEETPVSRQLVGYSKFQRKWKLEIDQIKYTTVMLKKSSF